MLDKNYFKTQSSAILNDKIPTNDENCVKMYLIDCNSEKDLLVNFFNCLKF